MKQLQKLLQFKCSKTPESDTKLDFCTFLIAAAAAARRRRRRTLTPTMNVTNGFQTFLDAFGNCGVS